MEEEVAPEAGGELVVVSIHATRCALGRGAWMTSVRGVTARVQPRDQQC